MNRRPIVFDPLLGECCELDLDAIARLCDVYHLSSPVCWGALHAATLDERLRRTQLMRTRPGGISAPPTRITIPILKARQLEDGYNSLRHAYRILEPATREATGDGCRARAVCRVLEAVARAYKVAADHYADAEAARRAAMARSAPTN